jgi:hypothetical protein
LGVEGSINILPSWYYPSIRLGIIKNSLDSFADIWREKLSQKTSDNSQKF